MLRGGRNGTKGPPYGTDRKEEDDCVTLEAKDVILDIEIESMLEHIDWKKEEVSHLICVTVHRHVHVEQKGIVFLDEIVLMLVPKVYSYREICCPLSKEPPFLQNFGNILFIANGSFHSVKPNDMLTSGIK